MSEPDTDRGLYRKYELHRVDEDGSHRFQVFTPFFVLRYDTDPHARVALAAYANSCEADYPQLAADLQAQLAQYEDELSSETVGFTVRVPYIETVVGMKLLEPSARPAWAAELQDCARHIHAPTKAALQDETTDWAGSPAAEVVLWCEDAVDITRMRRHLQAHGYFISKVSHYYEGPIA